MQRDREWEVWPGVEAGGRGPEPTCNICNGVVTHTGKKKKKLIVPNLHIYEWEKKRIDLLYS